jgi:hypothetical protein
MMVFIVEQHKEVLERYVGGDADALPFALTCVNCTDMLAKVCMLESKVRGGGLRENGCNGLVYDSFY